MRTWIAALLLVLAPLGARADLTALFDTRAGSGVSVEYRDARNFRINLDPETYQLVQGGRMFLVATSQGEREVIPISDVGEQLQALGLGGMAQRMLNAQGGTQVPDEVRFRPLGRHETIAGYTGEVYEVTVRDARGEQRVEAVLSPDPELGAVQDALISMAEQAIALLGYDVGSRESRLVRQVRAQKLGALLRWGEEFRLRAVLRGPIAQARLELR
jgi:hypothetical protein